MKVTTAFVSQSTATRFCSKRRNFKKPAVSTGVFPDLNEHLFRKEKYVLLSYRQLVSKTRHLKILQFLCCNFYRRNSSILKCLYYEKLHCKTEDTGSKISYVLNIYIASSTILCYHVRKCFFGLFQSLSFKVKSSIDPVVV